jgi:hypothetical protein
VVLSAGGSQGQYAAVQLATAPELSATSAARSPLSSRRLMIVWASRSEMRRTGGFARVRSSHGCIARTGRRRRHVQPKRIAAADIDHALVVDLRRRR